MKRLELPTSCSQSRRATNCATPRCDMKEKLAAVVIINDTSAKINRNDLRICCFTYILHYLDSNKGDTNVKILGCGVLYPYYFLKQVV